MPRLVERNTSFGGNGLNPSPVPNDPGAASPNIVPTLDKPGVVGLDMLGGAGGFAGGVVRNTIGTLGEVINSPLEIVTGEIAQARLSGAIAHGDTSVSDRYISMVTDQGMSISDVADQMANDGVAVTGGVAHDLLIGVFLDPFNLIAAGFGKALDVGKRSADIQTRVSQTAANTASDQAARNGASVEDIAWLKGAKGRELLGHMYGQAAGRLGGVKKGMAQAMLGRSAGLAATAIGVNTLSKILDAAQGFSRGEDLLRAAGVGANNIALTAASELVVRRAFGETRKTAMVKAKIVAASNGVNDGESFAAFARATGFSPDTADFSLAEVQQEWNALHDLIGGTKPVNREQVLLKNIIERDTAGLVNENIGQAGVLPVLKSEIATDEVGLRRQILTQREANISENLFTLSSAASDAERASLAADEFIRNLTPVIGEEAARAAWAKVIADIPVGKQSSLNMLAEAMYSSQILRYGTVADGFAAAKSSLLARLNGSGRAKVLAALPENTRTLIINQAERFSLVAKDTLTDKGYSDLLKALQSDTLTIEEKAQQALHAVYKYSVLSKQYDAKSFEKIIRSEPQKAVDSLTNTLKQYSVDSFAKEVPHTNWRGADAILPELEQMSRIADSGEYKIVFEPTTASSAPNRIYTDLVGKDTSRFGVDLWTPITNDVMKVDIGDRNKLGKMVDYLNGERMTSMVVANTLHRMQEYVVSKNIPLSRAQVMAIHRELTDYGFKTKGSIRTAADDEFGGGTVGILEKIINQTATTDPAAALALHSMSTSGELRRMIFWAAQGDLNKVGITTKFTGWLKTQDKFFGRAVTELADKMYPGLKFRLSPIFGIQEVVESKWWNLMRGYQDEWKLPVPGGELRWGNKRVYDIVGPDGKIQKLDALEIMTESMILDRVELKYAQELASINMYFNGQVTDQILAIGQNNEQFSKGLISGFFQTNPAPYKNMDYLKFVSAEGLDSLSENLAQRMQQAAPAQWATWLAMAGGNKRGAALLFLKERQQLIRSRSTARAYWESQKHYGVGFGRQYDDTPVKNLDRLSRDTGKIVRNGLHSDRNRELRRANDALSLIHADAAAIGYSKDSLMAVEDAMRALNDATDLPINAKNVLTKRGQATLDTAMEKLSIAKANLRREFEAAVARKQTVKNILMKDGLSQPLATEMASLFVVAERRREMLPPVSNAISKALKGEQIPAEAIAALKDHLMKIRMARTEEESLWNAIGYGLDNAMNNADRTHFFNPGRGFLEKSINHPVFGLYPTSYMFGKVLPEYARMLYLSPTKGVAGLVLAPYMSILKKVSFGKFSPEDWGKYAPLVGFSAAMKIRPAMVESMNQNPDPNGPNPIVYMFANILVPGIPTEISASFSAPVRTVANKVAAGGTPGFGDIAYGAQQLAGNAIGLGRTATQTANILDYAGKSIEQHGGGIAGIIGTAGETIGDAAQGVQDFIMNKR